MEFSKNDFWAKMTISYKEARETHYWLRLLNRTGYLPMDKFQDLLFLCEELIKIIGAIRKTTKIK